MKMANVPPPAGRSRRDEAVFPDAGTRLPAVRRDPGADPPIVWLHGWACSSTGELMPAAVQPSLRGRRSLLVDFLGHGYSDRPTDFAYTVEAHAGTIVALLDGLALSSYALVGHSMGGGIAIHVAAARPDVVSSLVLAETWIDPHGEEVFDGQTEDEFVRRGFADFIAADEKAAEAQPSSVPAAHVGITRLVEPRALYREDVSMRDGTDPATRLLLAGLRMPRWHLQGELSDPEPEFEREMAEMGVGWRVVPKTGHAMGLVNPEGLADAVADLLPT